MAVVLGSLCPGVSFSLCIHHLSSLRTILSVEFRVMHCSSPGMSVYTGTVWTNRPYDVTILE